MSEKTKKYLLWGVVAYFGLKFLQASATGSTSLSLGAPSGVMTPAPVLDPFFGQMYL